MTSRTFSLLKEEFDGVARVRGVWAGLMESYLDKNSWKTFVSFLSRPFSQNQ